MRIFTHHSQPYKNHKVYIEKTKTGWKWRWSYDIKWTNNSAGEDWAYKYLIQQGFKEVNSFKEYKKLL